MLDRAPLLAGASIRDFQEGRTGNVANVVEQALLLSRDMVDLRSLRKHEVFLSLRRDLALVNSLTGFFFFFFTTIFALSNTCIFSSLTSCSRCV